MRKIALGLAILTVSAGAAFAQTDTSFTELDVDTSGELSFDELKVTFPDLTEEAFTAADGDQSGGLNSEELEALQGGTTSTTNEGGTPGVPTGVDAAGSEDDEASPSGGGEADNDGSENSGDGSATGSSDGSSN